MWDPQQGAHSLHACLEHGFLPPLYVCAVRVNDAVMAVRYAYTPDAESMEATVLAAHAPEPRYGFPITMMITDIKGNAVRVVMPRHDDGHCADRPERGQPTQ
jgi:hypothetical protein